MTKPANKRKNYQSLKKFCLQEGADLFGVADISGIKQGFLFSSEIINRITAAVSLGCALSKGVLYDVGSAPTRLYFHHYRMVNAFLDQLALKTAKYIERKGYLAVPVAASQIVDWQKQTAHLNHKDLARLAGLGWIGRNNLLVNKRYGSQIRLVTILTDMPLFWDSASKEDCAKCELCVKICPAQAIGNTAAEFDHLKCLAKLKEFQKERLVDQYICGVCVRACTGER